MEKTFTARTLLRTIRYEHWLRYYFAQVPPEAETRESASAAPHSAQGVEDMQDAMLQVPPLWVEASRREEPELFPVLEELNGQVISLERSRAAVFQHSAGIAGLPPNDGSPGDELFHLVADPDFRRGLDAFHGWVQILAGPPSPDRNSGDAELPVSFSRWESAFFQWEREHADHHVTQLSFLRG